MIYEKGEIESPCQEWLDNNTGSAASEKTIRKNLERTKKMLEKVTLQRDHYLAQYEQSRQDYEELNSQFIEYQKDIHGKLDEFKNGTGMHEKSNRVIVRMIESLTNENKKLLDEMAELRERVKHCDPEVLG